MTALPNYKQKDWDVVQDREILEGGIKLWSLIMGSKACT